MIVVETRINQFQTSCGDIDLMAQFRSDPFPFTQVTVRKLDKNACTYFRPFCGPLFLLGSSHNTKKSIPVFLYLYGTL